VATEKVLKAAAQATKVSMLPLTFVGVGLLGWYISLRGKKRGKEARV